MVSQAVVLVGGTGPALRASGRPPLSVGAPSGVPALVPLGNRPFLFHVLDSLADAGIEEAILLVDRRAEGHVASALARPPAWPLEVRCLVQEPANGLVGALTTCEEVLGDEPVLLHMGDSLCRAPLDLDGLELGPLDTLVLVEDGREGADTPVVGLAPGRVGAVRDAFSGKSPLAGVAVLGPEAVRALAGLEPRQDAELELVSALERLAALGGAVHTRHVSDWWRCRGHHDSLLDANRFVLDGLPATAIATGELSGNDLHGAVAIHPSARVESTVIRGPVVVGPRARISDAYIGPYTSIGPEVEVEGAEVEHSIIFAGASVSHLGGRLEGSVIGPKARVFRDFRLPKALRVQVGEQAEISLS